jgi:hypothetical protein
MTDILQPLPPTEQYTDRLSSGVLARRTFTIRVGELRAVLLFASDDETRFVLNSVRVEVKRGKAPLLIATDGRRLAAIETVADQGDQAADVDFEVTLASTFLKPLAAFAKSQSLELFFDYRPQDRIIANFVGQRCYVDSEYGAVIPQAYPNWRACLPVGKKSSIPHIGVNAEFVGDFAKAAKFLDCDNPIIAVNLIGKEQALEVRIEVRPQFYGVLMPAKVDEDREFQPEFLELIGFTPDEPEPEKPSVTIKSGDQEVTLTPDEFSKAAKRVARQTK